MLDYLLGQEWFQGEDPILKAVYTPGKKGARLIVCTGSNATGKSFFGRLISAHCRYYEGYTEKPECIRIGMEIRATEGLHRAFVLQGLENEESTGVNSVHMLRGAFNTAKGREHDNILVIDEPDIGLSESYSVAMGQYIAQQLKELSKHTKLVVVISHSRSLVKSLLPFEPAHLRFGDELDLDEWITNGPPPKTIEELLDIPNNSREIWRKILRVIDERKKTS